MDAAAPAAGRALRDAVMLEIPEYATSGNPDIVPEMARHGEDHMREIRRLVGGGEVGDLAFAREHAHRRAEQRFPLELVLHAYRCGHRVLSHWIRDAAIASMAGVGEEAQAAIADFALEYVDAISTVAASEYVARTRVLAEAAGDQRTELLNILLSGYDEADGRVASLLKRAGYLEQRRAYCVALARATHAAEMENPARAQRIVDAISTAFASTSIRALVGVRGDIVVAVLSDVRRQSGWTTPRAGLAARAAPALELLGPSVIVGLSADRPSTASVPKAKREAMVALDFANAARRVVAFADLPVRALLVHRGRDDVNATPPAWLAAFRAADVKSGGAYVETLRAVADADLNVQSAARKLGKHPNTLYARLERIKEATGFDGRRYHDLTELLLACECEAT
ncbi:MAG: helix-turn-helix domain-containing protein [Rhodoblastus sp.]|nr:helix-turn-helix domain-containing protein [Rhodoblastus sp.]